MEQSARKQASPINVTKSDVESTEAKLAKTLKMFREVEGLTQEQVARAIGTSVTNISHWENGLKVPRPEWLTALAKLYGVEVGNLFGVITKEQKKSKKR